MSQRNEMLGEVSSRLKALSDRLGVFVVVTNQVTSKFSGGLGNTAAARASVSSELELQAALGVAWAHAVNTRFLLQNDGAHRVVTVAKVRASAESGKKHGSKQVELLHTR